MTWLLMTALCSRQVFHYIWQMFSAQLYCGLLLVLLALELLRSDGLLMRMVSQRRVTLSPEVCSYRVLMIAPTSFFADYGCHVRILEETRALQKLGHRVTIATYHNGKPIADLDIRRTLPIPWRKNYEVGSSRHKIGFDALLGLATLQMLIRERFDVIHAHLHEGALIGIVLGRLFNIPVVFDFQGSLTGEMLDHHFVRQESRVFQVFRSIERWIDHHAPVILTSTANAERLLVNEFGCSPDQIWPLPDCVNGDIFRPATEYSPNDLAILRQSLGIPSERKVIVYLGLLAEYQGIGLLLQAVQQIVQQQPNVHLLLMGFPNVAHYQARATELGICDSVTFTGRLPYQQAPLYLALGDVAVAPKLSLTEGSGKLLNYMAVGLPTVAFDTPVAREYLGSDGLYAAAGDVGDLARQLMVALSVSVSCQQRGQRLRERALQRFGWHEASHRIVDVYRRLLAEPGAPAQPEQAHRETCR